jgi:hypothetical protein
MGAFIILGALTRVCIWYQPGGRLGAGEIADSYCSVLVRALTA